MVQLNKSSVAFDKESHTYHLDGIVLGGVTAIVKWMYPDTYKDIPEEVLMRAAEYGSMVHAKCEMADRLGIVDSDPVRDYVAIKDALKLRTVANEYLVSDEKAIASSIDVVLQDIDGADPDVFPLSDIKTTSKVHFEHVRLQLSIYAYLFEKNNPGKKAGKLYVFWLPKPRYGRAQSFEVQRISAGLTEKIIEAYENGEDSMMFPEMIEVELGASAKEPAKAQGDDFLNEDVIEELIKVEKALDDLKAREKELKDAILKKMQESDTKKWSNDSISITKKAASKRVSVDSKALQERYPNIYEECKKESTVSESLTIKLL